MIIKSTYEENSESVNNSKPLDTQVPELYAVAILGLLTEGAWVPSEVIKTEVLSFQYYVCSTELS